MNILFITSNRIGDAVLSTGLLAILAERHIGARFTVACGPLPAPLFTAWPGVERVIALQKRPWARHWLDLWRLTVGTRWDLIIDLRGSVFSYTVRARRRLVLRPDKRLRHQVERLSGLLGLHQTVAPRIFVSPAAIAEAERRVPNGPPVLALAPTANWVGKEWPATRFAEVARALTAPGGILPGGRILLLGAEAERPRAEALIRALAPERTIDLMGRIDLPTAYACLRRVALFIGNDSGLMHLAAASGIATLGLFGPSRDERYAPFGPNAAVVRTPETYAQIVGSSDYDPRSGRSYMMSLGVDRVVQAAERLWQERRRAA